jgi:hypothetical protein
MEQRYTEYKHSVLRTPALRTATAWERRSCTTLQIRYTALELFGFVTTPVKPPGFCLEASQPGFCSLFSYVPRKSSNQMRPGTALGSGECAPVRLWLEQPLNPSVSETAANQQHHYPLAVFICFGRALRWLGMSACTFSTADHFARKWLSVDNSLRRVQGLVSLAEEK